MAVMPATLLATNPFSEPTRIPLSTDERTVNHVSWKKQLRLPASTKKRNVVSQNPSSARERRVDFRPLGSLSEQQFLQLTRSANEELQQVRRDAGIITPPKTAPVPAPLVSSTEDLQLPTIVKTNQKDTSISNGKEKDKERGEKNQRVGSQGYSRVEMVRNLQKHKKSLSSTSPADRKASKSGRVRSQRQHRTASKVDSVSWGDNEVMIKGRGSVKGSVTSSTSSDDDSSNKDLTKLPAPCEKWECEPNKPSTERPCKSAFCRLPQVENKPRDESADFSTATLEDVILARVEGVCKDVHGGNEQNDFYDTPKEERIRWEGNEIGYNPDVTAFPTRPASSVFRFDAPAPRSDVTTPELSEGALSNDEAEKFDSDRPEKKRRPLKHSSAVLKDMNGNLSNNRHMYSQNIAANVIKKLQPHVPHVIWPENRFVTSNTVFVYGSPSRLAPVIVPSHSVDCPLCNFYTPSAYGEICPPNSPTPFMKKDYGFYPVERFYTDF